MADKVYDIKSCPFCGRGSQLEARESAWQKKTWFAVRCTTSKCPGHPKDPAEYATKEEAIKNWNRRNGVEEKKQRKSSLKSSRSSAVPKPAS